MLDVLKRFFSDRSDDAADDDSRQQDHDIHVAVCALFLEMARIDESFSDAEMETIIAIMKEKYGLSSDHADALLAAAEAELEASVDYWQFARSINENYSPDEKIEIIETLWRIVYIDGKLDDHENYLMHKLSNLLRLSHKQLIDAKVKVLRSN